MATVRFVSWGAIPIGSLAAGVLGANLGVRPALTLLSVLTTVTPALVFLSRLRSVTALEDLDTTAEP